MSESAQDSQKTPKYDWYQNDRCVSVTIFLRNIKEDDATIIYTDTNVTVSINLPENNIKQLNLTLAHKIIPDKCSHKFMSTKIEIKLMKLDLKRWTTLTNHSERPISNPFRKNWTAIERHVNEELTAEDAGDKLSQLYEKATDDAKKAMIKSYVESCGTMLSLNWEDVSKRKVPIKTPSGMEWKQWQ